MQSFPRPFRVLNPICAAPFTNFVGGAEVERSIIGRARGRRRASVAKPVWTSESLGRKYRPHEHSYRTEVSNFDVTSCVRCATLAKPPRQVFRSVQRRETQARRDFFPETFSPFSSFSTRVALLMRRVTISRFRNRIFALHGDKVAT